MEDSLRGRGALIFPKLEAVPFNPYRGRLYTPQELYAGIADSPYEDTPDARVYQWSIRPGQRRRLDATLAAALHDHSIGDALDELTRSELCAGRHHGGGHGRACRAPRLRRLRGRRAAGPAAGPRRPGGGHRRRPRRHGGRQPRRLPERGPGARTSGGPWTTSPRSPGSARRCPRGRGPPPPSSNAIRSGTPSLGIPTWFYGHEPPNFFATHIAKYFANAIREAILLELCNGGIVFLPGSGGTVQEIFQDACENYYGTPETITPMVLVGQEHWLRRYPAWPLLQSLAAGRRMESRIFLVDTVEEALAVLER